MKRIARRILSIILSIALVLLIVPSNSLARERDLKPMLKNLDFVWMDLEQAEDSVINESKPSKHKVVNAVLNAAKRNSKINASTIADITDDGFFFKTTDGLCCAYSYKLSAVPSSTTLALDDGSAKSNPIKKVTSPNSDVLLLGPYYGIDSNFGDEYTQIGNSLAQAMNGELCVVAGAGISINEACDSLSNKSIAIFDSHGITTNCSSYLCFPNGNGLDQAALLSGTAISINNGHYAVNGDYIISHMDGSLSNTLVWMGICEGMMTDGLCSPLINNGAGVVFGYSQEVTFKHDNGFAKDFFDRLILGETVANASDNAKLTVGYYDTITNAYPIFVSAVDTYPNNPDSLQNVHSDWAISTDYPRAIACPLGLNLTFDPSSNADSHIGQITLSLQGFTSPDCLWQSSNESVATIVQSSSEQCKVLGIGEGACTIYCTVTEGELCDTASCHITVRQTGGIYVQADTINCDNDYIITASDATGEYALGNSIASKQISGFIYDYILAKSVNPITVGNLLSTDDNTQAICIAPKDYSTDHELIWLFERPDDSSEHYNIKNSLSKLSLTRLSVGDYNDLLLDATDYNSTAQKWYYIDSGLCARSTGVGALRYINLMDIDGQKLFACESDASESEESCPIKLYERCLSFSYNTCLYEGEYGELDYNCKTTIAGTPISSLPVPACASGYAFDGWYTDSEGGERIGEDYVPSANAVLYAHYLPLQTIIITLIANGVQSVVEANINTPLNQIQVPQCDDLHYFVGWSLNNIIRPQNHVLTEDTTLQAVFLPLSSGDSSYNVTLLANSGYLNNSLLIQTYPQESLVLPLPEKEGAELLYWYDGELCYSAGCGYMPSSDCELLAVWSEDSSCKHSFDLGYCTHCGKGLKGDVNLDNKVNTADTASILRYVVGLDSLSVKSKLNAYVDEDSIISSADAALILRHVVGLAALY